ncbi:hypothetical protein RF55_18337 [Lasius niger]|uniref:Uncharacterized protein n=1 Tax=Lasius niger TaxID=67767 RepID=A0A0J7MUI1_LASNI|nr:hypothetical protein RF55_18337 [Lasius niger]
MNDMNGLKKSTNLFVTTLEEEAQMPQTREKLQTFGWEVSPHPPYSHLAPSDSIPPRNIWAAGDFSQKMSLRRVCYNG